MTYNYIDKLNTLINFGISNEELLTHEERKVRLHDFRSTLSYEKYSDLFNELESYILNEENDFLEKEQVIYSLIEFIRSFPKLEDNIELFPNSIKTLYNGFIEYKNLCVLFEQVYYSDICMIVDYNDIVNSYLEFLDKPLNDLFIHYCYSKVIELNKRLIDYLDKTEMTGMKNRDVINNPELENTLKESLNILNYSRG